MQLDTNVMYDPLSGEGLVCVNGRCVSNKRKFQVHDEKQLGLRSGNRRRRKKNGPPRRKRVNGMGGVGGRRNNSSRQNGIPMNPYENLEADTEDFEEEYGEEEDEDDDEDYVFEDQDFEEMPARDGKVFTADGSKP